MKAKPPKLELVDLQPEFGANWHPVFHKLAASPRARVRPGNPLLLEHDWRDVVRRYLRRFAPQFWVYRGGRHVAIHASPPVYDNYKGCIEPEAGPCLARIIEAGK